MKIIKVISQLIRGGPLQRWRREEGRGFVGSCRGFGERSPPSLSLSLLLREARQGLGFRVLVEGDGEERRVGGSGLLGASNEKNATLLPRPGKN